MNKEIKINETTVGIEFSNGKIIVNLNPFPINFDSPEGELEVIPSSGKLMALSHKVTKFVDKPWLVTTEFMPVDEGTELVNKIISDYQKINDNPNKHLIIVSSLPSAQAYKNVCGMVVAKGYETLPPQQKRQSASEFVYYHDEIDV